MSAPHAGTDLIYEVVVPAARPAPPPVPAAQRYAPPPQRGLSSPSARMIGVGVVLLIIGIVLTLAFALRSGPDRPTLVGGAGGSPEAVAKEFFLALDDLSEDRMKALARGDLVKDIDMMLNSGPMPIKFADGQVVDEPVTTDVPEGTLAVLEWEFNDNSYGVGLSVHMILLDEGAGYQICEIDDKDYSIDDAEDHYESLCN